MPDTIVFDSSPLNYWSRADCLSQLRAIVQDAYCVMPRAVEEELLHGASRYSQIYQVTGAGWLEVVTDASLQGLKLFGVYSERLGRSDRNVGECTVLAYAELHGCLAVIDDRAGVRAGTERGVRIDTSLGLLARGVRTGVLKPVEAERVVDLLRDNEAYLPCDGATFMGWATSEGLLDPSL